MTSLIDQKLVDNIRRSGCYSDNEPDRKAIMDEYSLTYDRNAENAIITGCQVIAYFPQILASMARFFDKKGLSYTFLSKEFCCGNTLYRPAIREHNEEAMDACRKLSKEFTEKTLEQAKTLNAKRLIIFCSPCYPIYKQALPDENIVFYPVVFSEVLGRVKFNKRIDYYAGCYKLHKKFSKVPMDLRSTNQVFKKIEGMEINRIKSPECCYEPKGLDYMMDNVETDHMVHICTGCYQKAVSHLPKESSVKVMMLPELIEMIDDVS